MNFLRGLPKLSTPLSTLIINKPNLSIQRTFAILNRSNTTTTTTNPFQPLIATATLLQPQIVQSQPPAAGFKVRVHLKKRCKDCYFVRRQDRLFVICPTHRRHKQMQMVPAERNTWILTAATQGKVRPW